MRSTIGRSIAAVTAALACVALPAASSAQLGFHQVAPTGAYLTASPSDNTVNPLIIALNGLGPAITLMPKGILRVAGPFSPDHNAAFSSSATLLPQGSPTAFQLTPPNASAD